jgi:hypothetical protein
MQAPGPSLDKDSSERRGASSESAGFLGSACLGVSQIRHSLASKLERAPHLWQFLALCTSLVSASSATSMMRPKTHFPIWSLTSTIDPTHKWPAAYSRMRPTSSLGMALQSEGVV